MREQPQRSPPPSVNLAAARCLAAAQLTQILLRDASRRSHSHSDAVVLPETVNPNSDPLAISVPDANSRSWVRCLIGARRSGGRAAPGSDLLPAYICRYRWRDGQIQSCGVSRMRTHFLFRAKTLRSTSCPVLQPHNNSTPNTRC